MGGKRASVRAIRPSEEIVPGEPVREVPKARKLPKLPESAWGVRFDALMGAWNCAKGLFDPQKAPERLAAMAPQTDLRLALAIFALGGFLIFAIWFLSSVEYIYVVNFEFRTLGEATGQALPQLEFDVLAPVAAYEFLLWCVIAFLINLAYEGAAFCLSRLVGGRGTLGGQMYLSSIVWLAISMSMVAVFLGPLYLLCAFTIASLVFVTLLYLSIYLGARAYSIAHGIDFPYALVIAVLLAIPRIVLLVIAMDWLTALIGAGNLTGV